MTKPLKEAVTSLKETTESVKEAAEPVKGAAEKLTTGRLAGELHTDRLMGAAQDLVGALGMRALSSLSDRVENTAGRLSEYAERGGSGLLGAVIGREGAGLLGSALKGRVGSGLGFGMKLLKNAAVSRLRQAVGGGSGKSRDRAKKLKLTNIVETIDVGAPARLTYDQWTRFTEWPKFTKKVENVQQEADEKTRWRAQIFWSHREWESTIIEQIPDRRIVWRSKGAKGYVDGAVTFHELGPELTRVALVMEYHPQGLFERTGNLWRAQGRRARLELKHFRRHMMTQAILHPEEIQGWRGEIRDGEVVKDHETALREEQERGEGPAAREEREERGAEEAAGYEEYEGAYEGEEEPEYAEEPGSEYEAGEPEAEYEGEEYEEEPEYAGEDERDRRRAEEVRREPRPPVSARRRRDEGEEEEAAGTPRARRPRPGTRAGRR